MTIDNTCVSVINLVYTEASYKSSFTLKQITPLSLNNGTKQKNSYP